MALLKNADSWASLSMEILVQCVRERSEESVFVADVLKISDPK